MTWEIFWSYLLTMGISAALVPLVHRVADALDIVAEENARTVHHGRIARIGGLAIYISFMIGAALFLKADRQINAVLIGGFLVFAVGFFDDMYNLSPKTKLLVEFIAASIVIFYGDIMLRQIDVPFLPNLRFHYLAVIITYFWVIGITNAINLIDGLDGLSAGISTIVLVVIAFTSLKFSRLDIAAISILLAGAICGFLGYNFHPASIFMGDCGALFIGYMISVISLLGFGYKSSTFFTLGAPIVMLAIPILDTFMAIIRRRLKGQKFSDADREHLHHTLMIKLDFGHTRTVIILYTVTILFAMSAFLYTYDKSLGLGLFLVLVLMFEIFIEYTGMVSIHYRPILSVVNLLVRSPNLPAFSWHRKRMQEKKEKEDPEMKNRKQKNLIVLVAVLLAIGALGTAGYFYLRDGKKPADKAPNESVEPAYVKVDDGTALMDEIYEELVSAPDEVAERAQVARYFAVDFFTWSNKEDREDVGGISYVLPDARIDFAKYATNYYYVNFDEHLATYGARGLPEVIGCEVEKNEESDFVYAKTSNDDSYDVYLNLTYESKDDGMPVDELMTSVKVTVLKEDQLYYVVGVDYDQVTGEPEETDEEESY